MFKLSDNISSLTNKIRVSDFMLLCFVMIYPFSVKVSLIAVAMHYLLSFRYNIARVNFSFGKESLILIGCLLFYLLHVLSLTYSLNFPNGLKDIETKFGFFIFPLLAFFLPRNDIQKNYFCKAFVFSFFIASLVCIVRAIGNYLYDFESEALFYDNFSFLMHPTYFTMHLSVALIFHLYSGYSDEAESPYCKSTFTFNFIICVLLIAVFLTSSRAGIPIALLSVGLLFSGKLIRLKQIPISTLLSSGLITFLMIILMLLGSNRFKIIFNELSGNSTVTNLNVKSEVDESPVAHRITLISVAAGIAIKHPIGVGAGDVQDVLVEEYKRIGYEKAAIVRYNPHNQYFQAAVALGIPGLFSLLIIFGALLLSIKTKGTTRLLFFVGLILALNGLFESVFEVQRGVLMLTLIVAFLCSPGRNNKLPKVAL